MKKIKFIALIMVACMTFMLTGCNLFSQDLARYLTETVITISYENGKKIEIDRQEFLTAYENYGSDLMQSQGYDEQKAKDATVDALVNRKVLLEEAKKVSQTEQGKSIALTDADKNEIMYQTYKSMISNAQSYDSAIKKDWNMEEEVFSSKESTSGVVYNKYTKKAKPVKVYNSDTQSFDYKIELVDEEDSLIRDITFTSLDEVYNSFIAETKNNTSSNLAKEEYRRYLAALQASQKVLKTNYSEEDLVKEEIKRIYKNLEENELLTKYQEFKTDADGYSYITVQNVIDKYKSMIYKSSFKYNADEKAYNEDILSDVSKINYFINDDYFYVAHILVKFSDEQQAEYDGLETLSNKGQGGIISAEKYNERKEQIYNEIKASVRDSETGEIVKTDAVSMTDLMAEINAKLSGKTGAERDLAFRELMYKYNEDDGIMNASYAYVVGENESKMVESFTNASRELNEKGEYGAISEMVCSEYGVHIIYYMGKCANPISINSDNSVTISGEDVLNLDKTYLNNLHNKTVFDLIYESLESDNYSLYENMNMDRIKNDEGIVVKKSNKLI